MANRILHTAIRCFGLLLFLAYGTTAMALPAEGPTDHVVLTAWMDLGDGNANDVIVEVNVNGTKDWGRPDANGRVELLLPTGAMALIHFRKPGHLTKTVSVDTHNLHEGSAPGKLPALTFGVKLEPDTDKQGLVYAGPVPAISFDAASGAMLVEQNQLLVPTRKQTVVF